MEQYGEEGRQLGQQRQFQLHLLFAVKGMAET